MDILEAIHKRKSIRGFKPDPVPRNILLKVMEAACRAPSAMNTQPWEFVVITGDALNRLKSAILHKLHQNQPGEPEHQVVSWADPSPYRDRQVELAKQIFKLMDIPREDPKKRAAWMERGFRFFDAPVGILLLTDRSLSDVGPLLDLGAAMQTLCLAALQFGLGTCIEDQSVLYPEAVREAAGIPAGKKIVIAIALGYPDWNFPANQVASDREPPERNTRWLGF